MGFGWQELLIILVIVGLIFGTSKLRNMGSDIGGAVKGFKKGLKEEESSAEEESNQEKED
tara:strand:- start:345 stop:524 length:180 start_codon:yes stop_codon:yes gene_type:complete